jgi:hypothetical protein
MKKNIRAIRMMTSMLASPPDGARDDRGLSAVLGVLPSNRWVGGMA